MVGGLKNQDYCIRCELKHENKRPCIQIIYVHVQAKGLMINFVTVLSDLQVFVLNTPGKRGEELEELADHHLVVNWNR